MPVYVLERDGRSEHRYLTWAEFDAAKQPDGTLLLGGETYSVDVGAQARGFRHTPSAWPKKCLASAVQPHQVAEAQSAFARAGVRVEFDRDGVPTYESRSHRRAALASIGLFDRDGGYSDPDPEWNQRYRAARGIDEGQPGPDEVAASQLPVQGEDIQ